MTATDARTHNRSCRALARQENTWDSSPVKLRAPCVNRQESAAGPVQPATRADLKSAAVAKGWAFEGRLCGPGPEVRG